MSTILYAGQQLLGFPNNRSAVSCWKLIYCTEGFGKVRFNRSEVVRYKKGCLVIIPPDRRHVNKSSEDFKGMVIDVAELPLDVHAPMLVEDDGMGYMRQLCESICFYYYSTSQHRERVLQQYFDLLMDTVRINQERSGLSQAVQEIENNIIRNFHDCNFELDEYLRTYPFSYDYLRKLFKKEIGVTPHRYLNDLRLNTAAAIFDNGYLGDANVAEVSRRCGFQEPLYFSRMFKKKFGLAPSYYEAKNTAKEEE